MKKNIILLVGFIAVILAISTESFAETEGNWTGQEQEIYGEISQENCTTNSDCGFDYICFQEHDGVKNSTSTGSCYPKWETFCVNNGTFTVSGGTVCKNSTVVYTCSSGTWSSSSCSSGYTCKTSTNTCTADSAGGGTTTGSGTSNSNGTNNPPTPESSLSIITYPSDFEITQNTTISKIFVVSNDGETNLTNLILSISGVDALVITTTPSQFSTISIGETKTFAVDFSAPETAAIGTFTATARASSGSVSDSKTFDISILPSNETVNTVILPLYDNYTLQIPELENQINLLKSEGKNTTEAEDLLNQFKAKLTEAGSMIQSGNYLSANQFLTEAGTILETLRAKLNELGIGSSPLNMEPFIFVIAIVIVIVAIGIVFYKFMPRKKEDAIIKEKIEEEINDDNSDEKKKTARKK